MLSFLRRSTPETGAGGFDAQLRDADADLLDRGATPWFRGARELEGGRGDAA